jgi:hypothetical protein
VQLVPLAPVAVVLRVEYDASYFDLCLLSAASTSVVSERVVNIELVSSSSSFSSNRSNSISQIIFHVESNASDPGQCALGMITINTGRPMAVLKQVMQFAIVHILPSSRSL